MAGDGTWLVNAPDIQAIFGEPADFAKQLARLEIAPPGQSERPRRLVRPRCRDISLGPDPAGVRRLPEAHGPQDRRGPDRLHRRLQAEAGRRQLIESGRTRRSDRAPGHRNTMPQVPRYYAAACQTDLPCPADRSSLPERVGTLLGMVDRAVVGYGPFFDIKLLVFPEFAHAAPIYATVEELARPPGRSDPQRADRPLPQEGEGAGRLHPDRDLPGGRPQVARRGLQHDLPDRPRRPALALPEGLPLAPLGGPRQPARPGRVRRADVPGRRDRDRPHSAPRSATTGCSPRQSGPWHSAGRRS